MTWKIVYQQDEDLVSAEASFRNVVGAMVMSVAPIPDQTEGSHSPPAGIFVLTTEADGTVSITPKSNFDMKSPALFDGSVEVITDTVTPNRNIIPGLGIILNMVILEGWYSEVGIGCYWDDSIAYWTRVSSLGLGIPGVEGADKTFTVQNDGGGDQSNCMLVVTNGARIVNSVSASQPFFSFRQVGTLNPTAHTDLLGKVVSFANYNYGLVDILVDGSSIDIYDQANDNLIVGGTGLFCDDTTVYRFADGTAYQSCEFILSSDLAASDTATIFVSDGGDLIELWDETTGDYVAGTTGVYLTAEDCGLGIVPDDETVQVTMRANPPSPKTISLNQRQFSIRIVSVGV